MLRCLERERPYVTALDESENEQTGAAGRRTRYLSELARNERIESLRKAVLALPPLIGKWWCCATCTKWIMLRLPPRWDAPLEPSGRGCIGPARC